MKPPSFVRVAAGCIQGPDGRVLICQRPAHKIYPGEWEFPGGKIEPGESAEQALRRELREELSIDVAHCEPLTRVRFRYPELWVDLSVWRIGAFRGTARSSEHPAIAWVAPAQLGNWKLLAANRPIVSALRLPAHLVFTPPGASAADLVARLPQLPDGSLLRLRLPGVSDSGYASLAQALVAPCRQQGLTLTLDRDPGLSESLKAGWHATAARLASLQRRPLSDELWFSASCHDASELDRARTAGVDFVVLGPVQATATHPAAAPLGWSGFEALSAEAGVPAYAIGGLGLSDLAMAQSRGARGIAGISAYWGRGVPDSGGGVSSSAGMA